jgi:hypothetical protein
MNSTRPEILCLQLAGPGEPPHVQVTTTALTKSLIGGVGGGGPDPFLLALMATDWMR